MLASLTFIVWNVGTRTPLELVSDIRRAGRDARAFFLGLIAFAVGLIFIVAALVLVLPAIGVDADVWPTLVLMFVVALAIELLVGPALRRIAAGQARTN